MENNMKQKLVLLVLIGLLFPVVCFAQNIIGIYGNINNSKNYFELLKDGSFFMKKNGEGFDGTYKVRKNVITFILPNGAANIAAIKKNIIIDDKDEAWELWTK